MQIYNLKDTDLLVINCKGEQDRDKDWNGVYRICYRTNIKDKQGVIIGGKLLMLYPTEPTPDNGVKYYVGNEEFAKMNGQVTYVNEDRDIEVVLFVVNKDEDGEIISLSDNIYKLFEELEPNEIVKLKYYPKEGDGIYEDAYYEFNYSTEISGYHNYVFTPLYNINVNEAKTIDLMDRGFIKDLGIKYNILWDENTILATSIALPDNTDTEG